MRTLRWAACVAAVAWLAPAWAATGGRVEPLGDGPTGVVGLTLVPLAGVEAKPVASAGPAAVRAFAVAKTGDERRLLALEVKPKGDLGWAKAIEVDCRLTGLDAAKAHLALVAWEQGGGAYYRIGASPGEAPVRLPLDGARPAAFSQDADGKLDWAKVERLWLGVVIDGPATGTVELRRAMLTSEPWRPTAPHPVAITRAEQFSVGKDPAVTSKVALVNEGPAGEPVVRFDFTFPGGRHMYYIPSTPLVGEDLSGYRALRLRFKAKLPAGPSLLLSLQERGGGQYIIDPAPAATGDWQIVEVPLAQLKLGGWSKDDNAKLDLEPGMGVSVGTHGTANPGGDGTIWVRSIELVP
jgi:hypothetical protein